MQRPYSIMRVYFNKVQKQSVLIEKKKDLKLVSTLWRKGEPRYLRLSGLFLDFNLIDVTEKCLFMINMMI